MFGQYRMSHSLCLLYSIPQVAFMNSFKHFWSQLFWNSHFVIFDENFVSVIEETLKCKVDSIFSIFDRLLQSWAFSQWIKSSTSLTCFWESTVCLWLVMFSFSVLWQEFTTWCSFLIYVIYTIWFFGDQYCFAFWEVQHCTYWWLSEDLCQFLAITFLVVWQTIPEMILSWIQQLYSHLILARRWLTGNFKASPQANEVPNSSATTVMFEALSVTIGGPGGRFHSVTASLNTLAMLTPVWLSGSDLV